MTPVDALQIWNQLAESYECREAVRYYDRKYCNIFPNANKRKQNILNQGAADFDQKYCTDDEHEKEHYRTDYYVGGYMDMHLKQNLAAFQYCFENDEIPQPLLLVDFGCGPMTSGLALAQILSKQSPDYKTHTAYLGIDASKNMVAKANRINKEYELFEHFNVVQGIQFNSQVIPFSFPAPKIVVLCFSFVLAPGTLQQDTSDQKRTAQMGIAKLANDWKEYVENQTRCPETRIIYLNPLPGPCHPNWYGFKRALMTSDMDDQFCYTVEMNTAGREYIRLSGDCHEVYYNMVHGIRE